MHQIVRCSQKLIDSKWLRISIVSILPTIGHAFLKIQCSYFVKVVICNLNVLWRNGWSRFRVSVTCKWCRFILRIRGSIWDQTQSYQSIFAQRGRLLPHYTLLQHKELILYVPMGRSSERYREVCSWQGEHIVKSFSIYPWPVIAEPNTSGQAQDARPV